MPSIHSGEWDPLFAACSDTEHRAVLPPRLVVAQRDDVAIDAPAGVAMTVSSAATIYTLVDLVWATFWDALPQAEVLAHRRRHRLDPVLPVARRARQRPPPAAGSKHDFSETGGPTQIFRDHILVLLHQGDGRPGAARPLQHRQRVLGVRLPALRRHLAERARGAREDARRARPTSRSTRSRHQNAMKHYQLRPVPAPAAGSSAPPPRCAPSRPTSTSSPASAARPTSATSSAGSRSPAPAGDVRPAAARPRRHHRARRRVLRQGVRRRRRAPRPPRTSRRRSAAAIPVGIAVRAPAPRGPSRDRRRRGARRRVRRRDHRRPGAAAATARRPPAAGRRQHHAVRDVGPVARPALDRVHAAGGVRFDR